MTELANTKTWTRTRVTASTGNHETAPKELLVKIKDAMISAGWVFVSSCDSINYGSTDYWINNTDLVSANEGTIHSWIVLQNDSVKTGFQICINMIPYNAARICGDIFMSPSVGFTNGNLINRPTALDEVKLNMWQAMWFSNGFSTTVSANVFISSDLECTHVFLYNGTIPSTVWIFDVPKDCPSWVDNKIVCMVYGSDLSFFNFNDLTKNWATMSVEGIVTYLCLGTLCLHTSGECAPTYNGVVNATGDYGTNWPCTPMWLLSTTTSAPGIYGTIYDLWWAPSTTIVTGDYFPGDSSKMQHVFGAMVQGNDGGTVTL